MESKILQFVVRFDIYAELQHAVYAFVFSIFAELVIGWLINQSNLFENEL